MNHEPSTVNQSSHPPPPAAPEPSVVGPFGRDDADVPIHRLQLDLASGQAHERRPVADKDHLPVMIGPQQFHTLGFIRLNDLRRRMAVGIVRADGDDGITGMHRGQKLWAARCPAAVMRHFEHRGREPPRLLQQQGAFRLFLDIGGEEKPVRPIAQPQHNGAIVERMAGGGRIIADERRRGVEQIDLGRTDTNRRRRCSVWNDADGARLERFRRQGRLPIADDRSRIREAALPHFTDRKFADQR
jgi:hypothetical protein